MGEMTRVLEIVTVALVPFALFGLFSGSAGPLSGEGDHPLSENVLVREGTFDLVVDGNGGSAGIVSVPGPSSASVDSAHLYAAVEGDSSASATIDGSPFPATPPYSTDGVGSAVVSVFKWDASAPVVGPGSYEVVVDAGGAVVLGHALVVVLNDPSLGFGQIILNDGNEALVRRDGAPSQHTTFHGVRASGEAELVFGVYGGDPSGPFTGGPFEFASFNGLDLARGDTPPLPDAPWDGDRGEELDLDGFMVPTVAGDNRADVGTEYDFIGWFFAGLRVSLTASIDIKPGSFPNSVNLASRGVIPVGLLSTAALSADEVDLDTVRFGPGMAIDAHGYPHWEDLNADGAVDLVFHFRVTDVGLGEDSTEACLTLTTLGGSPFVGCDSVRIVPP